MHRYFVTGTDTDVGKTRVTAALALALRRAGESPTIVKIVQTGVKPRGEGDAQHAGRLAGVPHARARALRKRRRSLVGGARRRLAAAYRGRLADELDKIPGTIVAEGIGGIMVPLNAGENIGHVARPGKPGGRYYGRPAPGLHQSRAADAQPLPRAEHPGRRRRAGRTLGPNDPTYRDRRRSRAAGKSAGAWRAAVCGRRDCNPSKPVQSFSNLW